MSKFLVILLLFFVGFGAQAQDSTAVKSDKPSLYWLYFNNYNLAKKYNDPVSARVAMYSMLNMDPLNDSLRFSLAYDYFQTKQYPSAILACMDILEHDPTHAGALEMSAVSYEQLGLKEKALTNYEQLWVATEDIETLYKYTFVLYDLKRYTECMVNIDDILLQNSEIDTKTMLFQLSETEQKEFSLRVAIMNLRGLVKRDQGDIEGARADFNKVLELAPDFVFAKNNLDEMEQK